MSYMGIGSYKNELQQRTKNILDLLALRSVVSTRRLDGFVFKPVEYKSGSEMPVIDNSFKPFSVSDSWGGKADSHA